MRLPHDLLDLAQVASVVHQAQYEAADGVHRRPVRPHLVGILTVGQTRNSDDRQL
jgi:hypothetical protein